MIYWKRGCQMKNKSRYNILVILVLINLSVWILSKNNISNILFLKFSYIPLFIFDACLVFIVIKNMYLKYIFTVVILSIGAVGFMGFKLNTQLSDRNIYNYKSKYIISEYQFFDRRQHILFGIRD